MIIGSGGNGGAINPFDVIGLQSFIDLQAKLGGGKK